MDLLTPHKILYLMMTTAVVPSKSNAGGASGMKVASCIMPGIPISSSLRLWIPNGIGCLLCSRKTWNYLFLFDSLLLFCIAELSSVLSESIEGVY